MSRPQENVSRTGSQQRTLVGILGLLRPHWTDPNFPGRLDKLLCGDRRLGSRDRRFYRELAYTAVRYLPWVDPLLDTEPSEAVRRIAWLASDVAGMDEFRADMSAGLPPCPAGAAQRAALLGCDAALLTPDWMRGECPSIGEAPLRDILLSRAPLWLRLQTDDPAPVFREFTAKGLPWKQSGLLKDAVEMPAGTDVSRTAAYLDGKVEVQDIGSQRVLHEVSLKPGGHWLDACAGAGGKALQLALLLGAEGRVVARDSRKAALDELSLRAARAGIGRRISVGGTSDPRDGFDGVLVDAPCSGSGTWRRSPHLKWSISPQGVRDAASLQLRLLRENAPRVRAGGLLVFATCSLFTSENAALVDAFLKEAGPFTAEVRGTSLLPQDHDGDGFFVASFRRTDQS